jgi:phospholipid/cholesterol/gamma-HCH transport system substrate-binding protein
VEQASRNVAQTTEQMPHVAVALRQTLSPENIERIGKLIAHLEKTGREAAPLVAELRALISSAQLAASRIDALTEETAGVITNDTLPRVGTVLQEVAGTSRQVARAIERLEEEPQALFFGAGPRLAGPGEPGFVAPGAR